MTPTFVLGVITVAATCFTAFSVGYMHRKQMRQIEARRIDPNLPIKPPPNAFTRWLLRNLPLLTALLAAVDLYLFMRLPGPATKSASLLISSQVGVIVMLILFYVIMRVVTITERIFDSVTDLLIDVARDHIRLHRTVEKNLVPGTDPGAPH